MLAVAAVLAWMTVVALFMGSWRLMQSNRPAVWSTGAVCGLATIILIGVAMCSGDDAEDALALCIAERLENGYRLRAAVEHCGRLLDGSDD